jgi:NADPH-dependent curcumin reductase CurA
MQKIDLSSYAKRIIANPDETESIIEEAKNALDAYFDNVGNEQKNAVGLDLLAQIKQGVLELSNMTKVYVNA